MSKLRLRIGFCLFLTWMGTSPSGWSQEVKHAREVEQCRADQRLWRSKLESSNATVHDSITFNEATDWRGEMMDCREVDPNFRQDYDFITLGTTGLQAGRMADFLMRHKLFDQFLAEDAQGCRGSEPCEPQDKR